jgi:hypothetical protein
MGKIETLQYFPFPFKKKKKKQNPNPPEHARKLIQTGSLDYTRAKFLRHKDNEAEHPPSRSLKGICTN